MNSPRLAVALNGRATGNGCRGHHACRDSEHGANGGAKDHQLAVPAVPWPALSNPARQIHVRLFVSGSTRTNVLQVTRVTRPACRQRLHTSAVKCLLVLSLRQWWSTTALTQTPSVSRHVLQKTGPLISTSTLEPSDAHISDARQTVRAVKRLSGASRSFRSWRPD